METVAGDEFGIVALPTGRYGRNRLTAFKDIPLTRIEQGECWMELGNLRLRTGS
jgi:hypothetical protein